MRPWLLLPLAVFATTTHQRARDWSEWSARLPCFIVNFSTPFNAETNLWAVDQMVICNKLMNVKVSGCRGKRNYDRDASHDAAAPVSRP